MERVKVIGTKFSDTSLEKEINSVLLRLHDTNAEVIDIKYTCQYERGYGETFSAMIRYKLDKKE